MTLPYDIITTHIMEYLPLSTSINIAMTCKVLYTQFVTKHYQPLLCYNKLNAFGIITERLDYLYAKYNTMEVIMDLSIVINAMKSINMRYFVSSHNYQLQIQAIKSSVIDGLDYQSMKINIEVIDYGLYNSNDTTKPIPRYPYINSEILHVIQPLTDILKQCPWYIPYNVYYLHKTKTYILSYCIYED